MTAHTQPLETGTRVTGNYQGVADYTGRIFDTWAAIGYPDGYRSALVGLDRPMTLFGTQYTTLCVVADADGTPVHGGHLSAAS